MTLGADIGDGRVARENEILRVIAGSTACGVVADESNSDLDLTGVYIENPEQAVGLERSYEHWVSRTQPEGKRSGKGDVDLTSYALRKFMRLAVAGNPSILITLYVSPEHVLHVHPLGSALRLMRGSIVSQHAPRRFLGYLDSQVGRMMGQGKQSRMPKRPELVEAHGYDCYLDDTEFLTRHGWRTYENIPDGMPLGTISQEDGRLYFQVPSERICRDYDGPIIQHHSRYTSWAVTPNHRMLTSKAIRRVRYKYDQSLASWGFVRADETLKMAWHERSAAEPRKDDLLGVSDSYLMLMGAYVSEGCVGKRRKDGTPSVLRFEQKDGGRLHAIMDSIAPYFSMRTYRYPEKRPVTTWTLADKDVAKRLTADCGVGSRNLTLPGWVYDLSERQALILIDAMMAGDGTPYRSGGWVYYSSSRELAGAVQALAIGAGRRSVMWGPYKPAGMYQVLVAEKGAPRLAVFSGRHVTKKAVISRKIVCFTVENETLVTRRDGKIAMHGNTKYAAAALRLGLQGLELATSGHISMPMLDADREACLAVRTGKLSKEEALRLIGDARQELAWAIEHPILQPEADMKAVNRWMIAAHLGFWSERGLVP